MNAIYTMTFRDFLKDDANRTWFESAISMSTDERSESLRSLIKALWENYEIGGETVGEFEMFMEQTFVENVGYYEQLLDAYEKKWDYEEGLKDTYVSSAHTSSSDTDETAGTTKGITVDLPNKKIDADDIYAYPDSGTKGDSESSRKGTSETDNTSESERTYGRRYMEMKNIWIRHLRNVYREFALQFSDCFVHIF